MFNRLPSPNTPSRSSRGSRASRVMRNYGLPLILAGGTLTGCAGLESGSTNPTPEEGDNEVVCALDDSESITLARAAGSVATMDMVTAEGVEFGTVQVTYVAPSPPAGELLRPILITETGGPPLGDFAPTEQGSTDWEYPVGSSIEYITITLSVTSGKEGEGPVEVLVACGE